MTIKDIVTAFNNQKVEGIENPVIQVPTVTAKIESIYSRKTGTGQFGDWSLQSALLVDSTDRIMVSFRNKPEIPANYKGRTITLKSQRSRDSIVGVRCEERNFVDREGQQRKVLELVVTKAAIVNFSDSSSQVLKEATSEASPLTSEFSPSASSVTEKTSVDNGAEVLLDLINSFRAAGSILLSSELLSIKEQVKAAGYSEETYAKVAITIHLSHRQKR